MIHWSEIWFKLPEGQLHGRLGRHPQGEGRPTLVFLHEALGSIEQWKQFPQQLAEQLGCHVLIYERLGHGASSALTLPRADNYLQHEAEQVLPRVLAQAGLEQVVLIGHSDGGSIALLGAAVMPDRVLGVITEAAHLFVEAETVAGIKAAMADYATRLRTPLSRYHGDKTDDLFAAWQQTWLRPSYANLDLSPRMTAIRCPVLVIQGQDDQYGTARQVESICAGIGSKAIPLWLAAAHCPHLEARESCLRAMTGFIQQLQA